MLGYARARGRRDARRVARPRAPRRARRAHPGARRLAHRRAARALRVRAPGAAPRRRLPLDARPRHRGARRATAAPTRVVGSLTDVTDRREAERRLQHDALHDALTGLPNRVLFLDRLDQAIRRAQRQPPGVAAPRCCSSTSTASRSSTTRSATPCGDQLLQAVARRLEAALRPNDTVARLGGDEFTLLLDDVLRAARGDDDRRARPAEPAGAVPARRARAVHRRVDRHRARDRGLRARGGHARRRRRHVPRQGRRQGPPRGVRRRDARAGDAPARPGGRPAPGDRAAPRWRSSTSRSCRPRPAAIVGFEALVPLADAASPPSVARPSPRRPGWSSRSAARCWRRPARSSPTGARCRAARG